MNSMSKGLRPWPDGAIKYKQQCTRESEIGFLFTQLSAFRYSSYLYKKKNTCYFLINNDESLNNSKLSTCNLSKFNPTDYAEEFKYHFY